MLNFIDASFYRSHESQFLIASEAYQVGTHDDHVNLVCWIGCPRTLTGFKNLEGQDAMEDTQKGNNNLIAFSQIISSLICVDEN